MLKIYKTTVVKSFARLLPRLVLLIAIQSASASTPILHRASQTDLNQVTQIWIEDQKLSNKAKELISFLSKVEAEGLEPSRYQIEKILSISNKQTLDAVELEEVELLFNDTFLKLAKDLTQGKADWQKFDPKWHIPRNPVSLDKLNGVLHSDAKIKKFLNSLGPQHKSYLSLKNALLRYQKIVDAGGWNAIETRITLKLGMIDPAIENLRQRLAVVGDLESLDTEESQPQNHQSDNPQLFDQQLLIAVKRFQTRHGLQQDGIVGPKTRKALNVSAEDRLKQIKINLERWRWMPRDLGYTYVMINTAAFTLDYVWYNETLMNMRVIVGDEKNPTPVFSGQLSYMDINPVWNVPRNIVLEEILPRLVLEPDHLEKNGFRILSDWSSNPKELTLEESGWSEEKVENFPFRLQQVPGNTNALGRVKFIFPNEFSIYLHDTPAKALFNKTPRNFSHGCIRVEKPKDLALALLIEQPKQWDDRQLEQALASDETSRVILENKLPVYITYFTSWVDETGKVYFSGDHYNRDDSLANALFSK